ncbi:MAG: hypothetical protein HW389_2237 [Bacteroidetes bacterium]|nr:hypothetical protein [Bacteroidota bacterium]
MQILINRFRSLCVVLVSLLLMEPLTPALARSGEDIAVVNVRFQVSGNKIVVSYDLTGPSDRDYSIKLILRRKQVPSYEYAPKALAGDYGVGKFGGSGRQITWEILREYPNGLEGDDFYFHIEATLSSSGSNLLYYLGGGAAAVGAVVYFVVGKKSAVVSEGNFPQPAGRPSGY